MVGTVFEDKAVSIHAPAWEATLYSCRLTPIFQVSIHAPAWEATGYYQRFNARKISFNPRPRMGGDMRLSRPLVNLAVSIHAPAWEATTPLFNPADTSAVSIHAPAWEATNCCRLSKTVYSFQSTPPHGRRHHAADKFGIFLVFQSTPPHGRRRNMTRRCIW